MDKSRIDIPKHISRRNCLRCDRRFQPLSRFNRFCPECKESPEWKYGSMAQAIKPIQPEDMDRDAIELILDSEGCYEEDDDQD